MSRSLLKRALRSSPEKTLRSVGFGSNALVDVMVCPDRAECGLKDRQLLVSLQLSKRLGGFPRGRSEPAERYRGIPPVLHVAACFVTPSNSQAWRSVRWTEAGSRPRKFLDFAAPKEQ